MRGSTTPPSALRSPFPISRGRLLGAQHYCQRTVGADSIRPPQQRNGKIRSSPTDVRYKSLRDLRYALRHDIRLQRAICSLRARSGGFSCRRILDLNPSSGSACLATFPTSGGRLRLHAFPCPPCVKGGLRGDCHARSAVHKQRAFFIMQSTGAL